jgi:hypothetical protein
MKAGTLTLVVRRCNSHEKNVIGIAQINGLNITKNIQLYDAWYTNLNCNNKTEITKLMYKVWATMLCCLNYVIKNFFYLAKWHFFEIVLEHSSCIMFTHWLSEIKFEIKCKCYFYKWRDKEMT